MSVGSIACTALYAGGGFEESVVFTVKGIDPSGRVMTFACGTDEQAMEKTWELVRRGFREIVVADPKGKEMSAAAFERSLDIDWGE
ncbi:hypothetical protein JHFBIEKO_3931 [Methylobacterium mesophilicum]|nr:hypothetical protein JHFBIEKO_3931 [Methylobacterium mesophilicum]